MCDIHIHVLRFKIIRAFQWRGHEAYRPIVIRKICLRISQENERRAAFLLYSLCPISYSRSFSLPSANNEKRDDHVLLQRISPHLAALGNWTRRNYTGFNPPVALGRIQPRTKRQRHDNRQRDGATERTKTILLCAIPGDSDVYSLKDTLKNGDADTSSRRSLCLRIALEKNREGVLLDIQSIVRRDYFTLAWVKNDVPLIKNDLRNHLGTRN